MAISGINRVLAADVAAVNRVLAADVAAINGVILAGGGGDPFFADVLYLSNMQGTNGGTTFTDDSPIGRSITRFGNTQTSTAQFIYGDSSAYFDGSGDYLEVGTGSDADLNISPASDFTIEYWFRPDQRSSIDGDGIPALTGMLLAAQSGGADRFTGLSWYNPSYTERTVGGQLGSTANLTPRLSGVLLSAATWYFFQAINDTGAGTFKAYLSTAAQAGTAGTEIVSLANKGLQYGYVGRRGAVPDQMQGYIGPIRITAAARAAFVPEDLFPTS